MTTARDDLPEAGQAAPAVGIRLDRRVRPHAAELLRQTADGQRHMVSPIGGGEHTLCGIAAEAHVTENAPRWAPSRLTGRMVTCEMCADVIRACRLVRVRVD